MKNPTQIFTNLFFTAYYNALALLLLQEKIYPQKSSITNFVNHFKTASKSELSEDIVSICDGGVNYWSIKINVSNNTLFDIQVNGIS